MLVKLNDRLGQVEVDGSALDALAVEDLRQLVHEVEVFGQGAVTATDVFVGVVYRVIGGGATVFVALMGMVRATVHRQERLCHSILVRSRGRLRSTIFIYLMFVVGFTLHRQ